MMSNTRSGWSHAAGISRPLLSDTVRQASFGWLPPGCFAKAANECHSCEAGSSAEAPCCEQPHIDAMHPGAQCARHNGLEAANISSAVPHPWDSQSFRLCFISKDCTITHSKCSSSPDTEVSGGMSPHPCLSQAHAVAGRQNNL